MTTVIMTVGEAIQACADYVEGRSRFDFGKRVFVYTGKGWGSPAAVRQALTDNYIKAQESYNALCNNPRATGVERAAACKRLENIRHIRESCRGEGFKQALATGALKIEGKQSGQSFYSVIKPTEAATFRYDSASNSAEGVQHQYHALKFTPVDKPIRSRGRPTNRPQMAVIFEELRTEMEDLSPTEVGRRVAGELYKRTKENVKPDTVTRALRDMGCIHTRKSRKK